MGSYTPTVSVTNGSLQILKKDDENPEGVVVTEIDLDFAKQSPRDNHDFRIAEGLYQAGLEGTIPAEEVPSLIDDSRDLYLRTLRFD